MADRADLLLRVPQLTCPIDVAHVNAACDLSPGVFELYATGYRNPYDFLWHSNGKMYANVNAGNFTAAVPGRLHRRHRGLHRGGSTSFEDDADPMDGWTVPGAPQDEQRIVTPRRYGSPP